MVLEEFASVFGLFLIDFESKFVKIRALKSFEQTDQGKKVLIQYLFFVDYFF
jgi:hypothetical protein